MVNIFSVIIFLRSGWVVAQAGIGLSVLMVFCTGNYLIFIYFIALSWCLKICLNLQLGLS